MSSRSARSLERLAAIGVDVWQARGSRNAGSEPAGMARDAGQMSADQDRTRIRLSSGDGDWLLVRRQPWRGSHEQLLADIMATIGTSRCRFGQWAKDSAAGEGIQELAGRGVGKILAFGPPPTELDWPGLLIVPPLDEIATDGAARRQLWRVLAPALAN
ncbi:MAG: hypothetical protein ACNA7J_08455 [Wenzhouxiangella sp.]